MDKKRFTSMAQTLRPRIIAYASSLCGNSCDAEDIAQDTLLKMWSLGDRLGTYRSAEALAVVIARNLCIDMMRMRRVNCPDIESLSDEASLQEADSSLIAAETAKETDAILRALPESQQIMLRMRHIEGMEYRDIAEMLGTTEGNVRTSLSRARQRVKNLFKERNL